MSMTQKDYELIGFAISQSKIYTFTTDREFIANQLAITFQADNPKFNKTKFLQACGIEQDN